jgi:hypothetical protein
METDELDPPRIVPMQVGSSIKEEFTVCVDERIPQNGRFILRYCQSQGWATEKASISYASIGPCKRGQVWRIFNVFDGEDHD